MPSINKQTLIIIGASTAIGFLGDSLTFSIAESQGKSFKFRIPTDPKTVFQILVAGVIGGYLVDLAVRKIQRIVMSDEEKALSDLYEREVESIQSGQRSGVMPSAIQWTKAQVA